MSRKTATQSRITVKFEDSAFSALITLANTSGITIPEYVRRIVDNHVGVKAVGTQNNALNTNLNGFIEDIDKRIQERLSALKIPQNSKSVDMQAFYDTLDRFEDRLSNKLDDELIKRLDKIEEEIKNQTKTNAKNINKLNDELAKRKLEEKQTEITIDDDDDYIKQIQELGIGEVCNIKKQTNEKPIIEKDIIPVVETIEQDDQQNKYSEDEIKIFEAAINTWYDEYVKAYKGKQNIRVKSIEDSFRITFDDAAKVSKYIEWKKSKSAY